jgi:hypothetical protein
VTGRSGIRHTTSIGRQNFQPDQRGDSDWYSRGLGGESTVWHQVSVAGHMGISFAQRGKQAGTIADPDGVLS